jgi:hypothetical protein
VPVLIRAEAGERLEGGGPALGVSDVAAALQAAASGTRRGRREQGRPTGGSAHCYDAYLYISNIFQIALY